MERLLGRATPSRKTFWLPIFHSHWPSRLRSQVSPSLIDSHQDHRPLEQWGHTTQNQNQDNATHLRSAFCAVGSSETPGRLTVSSRDEVTQPRGLRSITHLIARWRSWRILHLRRRSAPKESLPFRDDGSRGLENFGLTRGLSRDGLPRKRAPGGPIWASKPV